MFTQNYLNELLDKIDLVDFVRSYVPELKPSGNKFKACCPFHDENSASFSVVPRKGFYHCFGCGAHGNAINFFMEFTKSSFVDAVKSLSNNVGMEIPKLDQPEKSVDEKDAALRFMRTCAATRTAQEIYSLKLEQHTEAMAYLTARGVSSETIDLYGIGFAPDAWDTISKNKNINIEAADYAGLTIKKQDTSHVYDRFRNRIMFPIYGSKDYIIGFGGRIIGDQSPKYLNSPEGEFFKKGEGLFGLKQAQLINKTANQVFVVEGYMDTAMMAQYGVQNVVATMGTAVTEAQIKKLLRVSAHIVFCFDGDKAGQSAAQRVAELVLPYLNELQKIDLMLLPDGLDPDEFMRQRGLDEFMVEAGRAKAAADFLVDYLKKQDDTSQNSGMVHYLSTISVWSEKIKSAPMRLAFNKRAADIAGISLDALLGMANKTAAAVVVMQPVVPVQIAQNKGLSISVAARILAISFVREPGLTNQIDIGFLEPFLTLQDKELLFPLMVYVKTNPVATKDDIANSLAYNPHNLVIQEIVEAAKVLDDGFDAIAEAKSVVSGFRRIQRVWQIIEEAKTVV